MDENISPLKRVLRNKQRRGAFRVELPVEPDQAFSLLSDVGLSAQNASRLVRQGNVPGAVGTIISGTPLGGVVNRFARRILPRPFGTVPTVGMIGSGRRSGIGIRFRKTF